MSAGGEGSNAGHSLIPAGAAELLADRALVGLSHSEQQTLDEMGLNVRGPFGGAECAADEYSSFDLTAAAADLAMFGVGAEALPGRVRRALDEAAERFVSERLGVALISLAGSERDDRQAGTRSRFALSNRLGWLAAAAGIALAALAWLPRVWPGVSGGDEMGRIESALGSARDVVRATWGPWELNGEGPECKGVSGEVVWSDSAQSGLMKFTGLPANADESQQYQLWIIDATRGMEQRISGGVFSARLGTTVGSRSNAGQLVVPIHAPIHVNKAAAFAITIEKSGGTWVSDMKRRVVIASVK